MEDVWEVREEVLNDRTRDEEELLFQKFEGRPSIFDHLNQSSSFPSPLLIQHHLLEREWPILKHQHITHTRPMSHTAIHR